MTDDLYWKKSYLAQKINWIRYDLILILIFKSCYSCFFPPHRLGNLSVVILSPILSPILLHFMADLFFSNNPTFVWNLRWEAILPKLVITEIFFPFRTVHCLYGRVVNSSDKIDLFVFIWVLCIQTLKIVWETGSTWPKKA